MHRHWEGLLLCWSRVVIGMELEKGAASARGMI